MEKSQLAKAVELQIDFHLPYDRAGANVAHQLQKRSKDHALLIVATNRDDLNKSKAVFPEPLALTGLAFTQNQLAANKKTLLVGVDAPVTATRTTVSLWSLRAPGSHP